MANATEEKPKDLVAEFQERGTARLKEIRDTVGPMLTEEAKLAEMLGETPHYGEAYVNGSMPEAASPQPSPDTGSTPKKRRTRKGGTRADQAVELIMEQPGISASRVAETMKIKPNYLYRVLGDLEKEGRVKKQGREYFPAEA